MLKFAAVVLVLFASPGLYSQTTGRVPLSQGSAAPKPVRNNVAQPQDEIVTIRYFRIKKGTFDQFLKASQEDVWPFFDKIGARVIGMWKVFPAEGVGGQPQPNNDYDEVYLSTRYASLEHWKATRDATSLGGNGPDWEKCQRGLALRQSLTISTNVIFLKGAMAANAPLYMPGMNETYEKKP
ncbi:MAG TPA: hypothetical protein VG273_25150 [Bryobacteraceae bacterium]|jgi:hypothetical protein|nr:hypothetical protein [Bryobacteraceae bacterium]